MYYVCMYYVCMYVFLSWLLSLVRWCCDVPSSGWIFFGSAVRSASGKWILWIFRGSTLVISIHTYSVSLSFFFFLQNAVAGTCSLPGLCKEAYPTMWSRGGGGDFHRHCWCFCCRMDQGILAEILFWTALVHPDDGDISVCYVLWMHSKLPSTTRGEINQIKSNQIKQKQNKNKSVWSCPCMWKVWGFTFFLFYKYGLCVYGHLGLWCRVSPLAGWFRCSFLQTKRSTYMKKYVCVCVYSVHISMSHETDPIPSLWFWAIMIESSVECFPSWRNVCTVSSSLCLSIFQGIGCLNISLLFVLWGYFWSEKRAGHTRSMLHDGAKSRYRVTKWCIHTYA